MRARGRAREGPEEEIMAMEAANPKGHLETIHTPMGEVDEEDLLPMEDETPAEEAPAEEAPADAAPAEEAPADAATAEEAPADATPAEEAPADAAPA